MEPSWGDLSGWQAEELKKLLWIWNKEVFGDIDQNTNKFEIEIAWLEKKKEAEDLDETE